MARSDLLNDITYVIEGCGFENNHSSAPMTYQKSIKYPGLIDDKDDTAHFLLHTPHETIQIVAKWQEVDGTTIEKLGYTVLDATRTTYSHFVVICGGEKLVTRAIDFINSQRHVAPKIIAMQVHELEVFLQSIL